MHAPNLIGTNLSGSSMPLGCPVCRRADGGLDLASNASPSRFPCIGLVINRSPQNLTVQAQNTGVLTLPNWASVTGAQYLTPGASYYLSQSPGRIGLSQFTTGDAGRQQIGVAITRTSLLLYITENTAVFNLPGGNSGDVLTNIGSGNAQWEPATGGSTGAASYVSGSALLPSEAGLIDVSGLGLSAQPSTIIASLWVPDGADIVAAASIDSTGITAAGFRALLTGIMPEQSALGYLALTGPTMSSATASSILSSGSVPLTEGLASAVISGLAMDVVPDTVVCTVRGPSDGLILAASLDRASLSQDGFSVWLSGMPDSSLYALDYLAVQSRVANSVLRAGSVALAQGEASKVVSGLGLLETPGTVLLTVRGPSDGLVMFACLDRSTLTTDGFTAWLSGHPDSGSYYLNYVALKSSVNTKDSAGSVIVPPGTNEVAVSGLGLSFTPSVVLLGVSEGDLANGELIFACPVLDSFSADGFRAKLSAAPLSASCKLDYLLLK